MEKHVLLSLLMLNSNVYIPCHEKLPYSFLSLRSQVGCTEWQYEVCHSKSSLRTRRQRFTNNCFIHCKFCFYFPLWNNTTDKAVSNYRSQTLIKRSKCHSSLNPSSGTFTLPACSNTFTGVNFYIPLLLTFNGSTFAAAQTCCHSSFLLLNIAFYVGSTFKIIPCFSHWEKFLCLDL